jgi:hypothetical protein
MAAMAVVMSAAVTPGAAAVTTAPPTAVTARPAARPTACFSRLRDEDDNQHREERHSRDLLQHTSNPQQKPRYARRHASSNDLRVSGKVRP